MAELIPIANLRGPQGVKGDKGDTGIGWGASNIGDIHLDELFTPGTHKQPYTGLVTKVKGYPREGDPGHLQIIPYSATDPKGVTQEWTTYTNTSSSIATWGRYLRTCRNGVWSPWGHIPVQRIDQSVGRVIYTWDDLNNREQMIYGDTGDRDINDLIDKTIWNVTVAKFRRQNSLVELRLQLSPVAGNTGQLAIFKEQIPSGFRNQHTLQGVGANGANLKPYRIEYAGSQMFVYDITAGAGVTLIQQWTTLETWPTRLPGNPVGTLPVN